MSKKNTVFELVTSYWPAAIAVGVVSGVGWLIRIVFTNQTKLTQLETEISEREKAREREREDIKELKSEVRDMNTNLINFFANKHN
jgi:cell division protein FtsL